MEKAVEFKLQDKFGFLVQHQGTTPGHTVRASNTTDNFFLDIYTEVCLSLKKSIHRQRQ